MKKSLLALAALAATTGVFAQSSVTLYGVADMSLVSKKFYATNAANTVETTASQIALDSGNVYGSRFGLKGSEDLGGGLKANFVLEGGINVDNGTSGQGGATFGRQSFVGLEAGYGSVSFGRMYSSYDNVKCAFGVHCSTFVESINGAWGPNGPVSGELGRTLAGVGTAADALVIKNAFNGRQGAFVGYQARLNNAVKFQSANMSGVTASFIYAFGENKTTAVSADATLGFNLVYSNGPLNAALAYQTEKYPQYKNLSNTNTMLAANYDFGVAKVNAGYNMSRITSDTAGSAIPSNELFFGGSVPFGAAKVSASYARSKHDIVGGTTDSAFGLELGYDLSKRTNVYAGYSATTIQKGSIALTDVKNTILGMGVRHSF